MPIVVRCPNPGCGMSCKAPETARGRSVRCPKCQTRIDVSAVRDTDSVNAIEKKGPPPAAPAPPPTPKRIGRFEIRGVLGRGAFGVVYRGYDASADRDVAVKAPLPGTLDDPQRHQRFLREARAAARLRHPNIAPLLEAGGDGNNLYIASGLIEGGTLAQAIAAGRLSLPEKVAIVRALVDAVAYAHSQGIAHRDIKPANVLLDAVNQPHLLDFGLAWRAENAQTLTQEGAMIGTAAYMDPGVLSVPAGKSSLADKIASDQYSLGVLFYELLTGQLPFDGPVEIVLYKAVHSEPALPRALDPALPKDLETICLKAFAKAPVDRYANCEELAADLRRWQEAEPISARRLGTVERLVRWRRKNRAIAAMVAGIVATLLIGMVVAGALATWALHEASRADVQTKSAQKNEEIAKLKENETRLALDDATKQRKIAVDNWNRAEWQVYSGNIALAQAAWNEDNLAAGYDFLNACRKEFRGWEYDYLSNLFVKNQMTFGVHADEVLCAALSRDGKWLASGGNDKTIKLWDAASGKERATLNGHRSLVHHVSFSRDGKRVASASWDGTVKIWDVESGNEIRTLKGHNSGVFKALFRDDDTRLVSIGTHRDYIVWDVLTGEKLSHIVPKSKAQSIAYSMSPDGKRVVSGEGHDLKVMDAATGITIVTLAGHIGVFNLSVSGNGETMAGLVSPVRANSGYLDVVARLWDAATGKIAREFTINHPGIALISMSHDGKQIVTGSDHGTIKLWDTATGRELRVLKGHSGRISSLDFTQDGTRIVSGSADGTAKVWNAATPSDSALSRRLGANVVQLSFSDDSRRVLCGFRSGVEIHDVDSKRPFIIDSQSESVTCAAFARDGKSFVRGGFHFSKESKGGIAPGLPDTIQSGLKVWDATTGQELYGIKLKTGIVTSVGWSNDGRRIAYSVGSYGVGGRFINGEGDYSIRVWDTVTREESLVLSGHRDHIGSVSFSDDDSFIVSASRDKSARIWDIATRQEKKTLYGHSGFVTSAAFSRDGKRIVTGGGQPDVVGKRVAPFGELKVWDAATGLEILALTAPTKIVTSVAFAGNDRRIVSGGMDKTVRVYDAATGQETIAIKAHAVGVTSVAFSRDSSRIVSGDVDGKVLLFDASRSPDQ